MKRGYERLFIGHSNDAPGRSESWTESLRYLGKGQWMVLVEGTDFSGSADEQPVRERFSTKRLVEWVLQRDVDIQDGHHLRGHREGGRRLGNLPKRLLQIAQKAGARHCVKMLEAWQAGTRPRRRSPPRILRVTGVTLKGVWLHVCRAGFEVETTAGMGRLLPPTQEGYTTLEVDRSEWQIRLSRRVLKELAAYGPALEALGARRHE